MTLSAAQWSQVETLFADAVELPPALRAPKLERAALDPEVRAELDALLTAADSGGDFLDAKRMTSAALQRLLSSPEAPYLQLLRADLQLNLGLALARSGQPAEAREPLRAALAWREGNLDPTSPLVAEGLSALAEAELGSKDRAQARVLSDRAGRALAAHAELGEHWRARVRRTEAALRSR